MEVDTKSGDDGDKEIEAIGDNDRTEATKFLRILKLHRLPFLPTDVNDDVRLGTIDLCSATYGSGDSPQGDEVAEAWIREREDTERDRVRGLLSYR
jgi:hypothetical protein